VRGRFGNYNRTPKIKNSCSEIKDIGILFVRDSILLTLLTPFVCYWLREHHGCWTQFVNSKAYDNASSFRTKHLGKVWTLLRNENINFMWKLQIRFHRVLTRKSVKVQHHSRPLVSGSVLFNLKTFVLKSLTPKDRKNITTRKWCTEDLFTGATRHWSINILKRGELWKQQYHMKIADFDRIP
jgi:hypothetical protein